MKISSEDIIKTLFALGFKEVSCIMFTFVLGKISSEDRNIKFEDKPLSNIFNKYIYYDGISYKINPMYDLNTIIYSHDNYIFSLFDFLSSNKSLLQILENLKYDEIIPKEYHKLQSLSR